MENEKIKENYNGRIKAIFSVLAFFTILLFISLTVFFTVSAFNKIQERKYIGQEIKEQRTITVSGSGEIYAKPDLALATFSVVNEAKTVSKAMTENTEKMNAVISYLKGQGVEEKDLKTVNFYIYPRYDYYEKSELYPSGRRVLAGYEITQSLQVKIRDMTKIGQIIEGATQAGANQIGDLSFTIDKQDELKAKARLDAINKAKEKAKELSLQLGVNLVRITSFSENSYLPNWDNLKYTETETGGAGPAPQVQTGENKIEVTVSITYEID
jgi:hypothetical protein